MSSSETKWVRLGDYIEVNDIKNTEGKRYPFFGINKDKTFMPTVADTNELDNTKYKIVEKGTFVFSGMQTGRDVCIRIAVYDGDTPILVSPAYTTFKVKNESVLLPIYLFLLFNRSESDRFGWFLSDGSIRSNLDWERFCDIEIPLPDIEVQKELVEAYNGLKTIAEQNEALQQQISAACHAYIVDCREKYPHKPLGDYIEILDKKNVEGNQYQFYGINKDKAFMPTVANTTELDNSKYKIVEKGVFAFSGMQTGRDICIRIALSDSEVPILISPAYTTFKIREEKDILPAYFFLQFKREESDRLGWFLSDGSIRSNLDWERFCDIQIPVPPIEVQQAIVDIFNCAERAKKIANEARERLKSLCPALVQRAAHS
ncbi:MAG: restriction endonuclease subunit S [Lachnospiraceae bacterium]|nr:restriction endonuclease subunit S [Lachnospiraceae bacterium]